ncbi:hypothetical protein LJC58_05470 [Lachnospiraceae bacterium OttesenSCG-928-D06]|nr:hypothetical protein [Lachnospiraceae bacterium OttesenSCG-928-D06]
MKIRKIVMLLIVFLILLPMTVSAMTIDNRNQEDEKNIETTDGITSHILCFHTYEIYKKAGDSYSNNNNSTHTHRYICYAKCTKCGSENIDAVESVESHSSRMIGAKCTGSQHIYEYGCVCGQAMGTSREACARPGNCMGLPLSLIIEMY